jgi:adenylate cyclase
MKNSFYDAFFSKKVQIALGLLSLLLVLIINFSTLSTVIDRLNFFIYDHILSLPLTPYKEITKLVIVDIDDESFAKEGRWPWPRNKLAHLISNLQKAGVVVTGADIIMSSPEINYAIGLKDRLTALNKMDTITPQNQPLLKEMLDKIAPEVDNDEELARTLKSYDVSLGFLLHNIKNVQLGTLPSPLVNQNGQLLNPQTFNAQYFQGYNASLKLFMEAAGHGGFVTNLPDSDGVIRRGLLLASIDNKVYPSLALSIAMRFLLADHVDLKIQDTFTGKKLYGMDLAGTFVPTNARGQILIPYWGGPFTLPYVSATDVLNETIDMKSLSGSIAIIGSSALMLSDLHPSPTAPVFPGVEMVGNMVAAIVGQQLSTQYDWYSPLGITVITVFGTITALLMPFLNIPLLVLILIILSSIIIAVCVLILLSNTLFIPVGVLLIIVLLQAMINYSYQLFLEKRQKSKIKQLFGQYVPESYVDVLINTPDLSMEGQLRELSVLFCDIRNFTTICEQLSATEVKRLLNNFFSPVTKIIFDTQGTIDKYVGDMVIAFWGAPIPIENNKHALQATLSALNMFKALPSINKHLIENGLPPINIGIGIGTGLMNVGDMGSTFRKAYTVLGDNVNLASRLESLTKYYDVPILVNDVTREGQTELLWRTIDKVVVKGRKSAVSIYQPLGLFNEISLERLEEIETYHKALEYYYAQDWDACLDLFKTLQEKFPTTYLYTLYLLRIQQHKENPPPKNWDGAFTHTEK